MDYKELLIKYINHVGNNEGTTFLDFQDDAFTDAEWAELTALDEQALKMNTEVQP
jgi:hypothetical protein